ncbi:MAG: carbohydrate ABC transporter permease [Beijerinckiaceae bacterium]
MKRHAHHIHGWLLVLPAMAFLALFTHWPAIATLIDSFYSTPKGRRPARFIGLENYQQMMSDAVFWKAAYNNLIFAGATIPLSILLALVMAIWVNDRLPGRSFLRTAYFTPTILPMIAVANIWLFFFTPQYGMLDQVRGLFGGSPWPWLGSEKTALACIIIVAVWKEAGFFMIFYLAALQQISPTLGEAAALEGASRYTYFRRVLWPLLMPTTLFIFVNAAINAFRMIDHIFVLTHGGPDNATTLLLYHVYEVGFKFWDTAYAAALTVVLLVTLALIAAIQYGVLERRIHYR